MASRSRASRGVLDLALLCLAVLLGLLGPRLVEAHAALEWTRYHARPAGGLRPPDLAREAARSTLRAVRLAAPLPWAREAVANGLEVGRRLEAGSPSAALGLYTSLRKGLDEVRRSPVQGLAMGPLLEEASRREEALKARRAPGGQR